MPFLAHSYSQTSIGKKSVSFSGVDRYIKSHSFATKPQFVDYFGNVRRNDTSFVDSKKFSLIEPSKTSFIELNKIDDVETKKQSLIESSKNSTVEKANNNNQAEQIKENVEEAKNIEPIEVSASVNSPVVPQQKPTPVKIEKEITFEHANAAKPAHQEARTLTAQRQFSTQKNNSTQKQNNEVVNLIASDLLRLMKEEIQSKNKSKKVETKTTTTATTSTSTSTTKVNLVKPNRPIDSRISNKSLNSDNSNNLKSVINILKEEISYLKSKSSEQQKNKTNSSEQFEKLKTQAGTLKYLKPSAPPKIATATRILHQASNSPIQANVLVQNTPSPIDANKHEKALPPPHPPQKMFMTEYFQTPTLSTTQSITLRNNISKSESKSSVALLSHTLETETTESLLDHERDEQSVTNESPDNVLISNSNTVQIAQPNQQPKAINLGDLDKEGLKKYRRHLVDLGLIQSRTLSQRTFSMRSNVSVSPSSIIEDLFKTIDTNKTGKISYDTFQKTLLKLNSKLARGYGENELYLFFIELDNNFDGYIDVNDFAKAFKHIDIEH